MEVDLPPGVMRAILHRTLKAGLPFKENGGSPLEVLFSNLYTQMLRDKIIGKADHAIEAEAFRLLRDKYIVLWSIVTMLVHKMGDSAEIVRNVDTKWFEDTDMKLEMAQDNDRICLRVREKTAEELAEDDE